MTASSGWFTAGGGSSSSTLLLEHVVVSSINLSPDMFRYPVAVCPYGGPIATRGNQTTILYTATGNLVKEWPRDEVKTANGKALGWLSDGNLALVLQDGGVLLYSDFNVESNSPPRLQRLCDTPVPVLTCLVWDGGIVLLTSSCNLYIYAVEQSNNDIVDDTDMPPTLVKILETRIPIVPERPPRTIVPLSPWISFSNHDSTRKNLRVALSFYDQPGMLVVGHGVGGGGTNFTPCVPDVKLRLQPSLILKSHPTLPIIASYGIDDMLIVCSWNWDTIYYSIPCGTSGILLVDMEWCFRLADTKNLILCSFWKSPKDTTVRVHVISTVNSNEDNDGSPTTIHIPQRDFVSCVEIDGVRIVTPTTSTLLRLVPQSIQSVYMLGSVSPAAMLVAAQDSLDAHEADGDAMLRSIDDLYGAITETLSAARCELAPMKRIRLLRAASLGAAIFNTTSANINQISEIAHKLTTYSKDARACTSVMELGLAAITPLQLASLSRKVFVARCARLCDFPVAMSLARWLDVDTAPIRVLAACAMVRKKASSHMDVDVKNSLLMSICDMLRNDAGGPTYCAVACVARDCKLGDLAFQLCGRDPSLERRVLFLLASNEVDRAISLVESAKGIDPELVLRTSLYRARHEALPPPRDYPVTDAALRRSLRQRDPAALERLLLSDVTRLGTRKAKNQATKERATLLAQSAIKRLSIRGGDELSLDETKFITLLTEAAREYEEAGRLHHAKHCKEFARLTQMQKSILSIAMVGTSLGDTIVDCISRNREDLAEKFRKEFDVNPKTFHGWRMRGLLKRGAVGEVLRLMKEDKEFAKLVSWPILVEQCFADGNLVAAASVAFDMPNGNDTAELKAMTFLRLDMYKEAVDCTLFDSVKHKEVYGRVLREVSVRSRDVTVIDRATTMLKELIHMPDQQSVLVATVTSNVGEIFASLSSLGERWRA